MDILIGILGIIIGVAVALAGLRFFILLLPIWGMVIGFFTGSGLTTAIFGDRFIGTSLGLVVGIVAAILFMGIAYLYWYFMIVIAAGAAGAVLSASIFSSLGVSSSWLIFTLGVIGAALFMIAAVIVDYPVLFVIVNTAIGGSAIAIAGVLLVFNRIDRQDIGTGAAWEHINDHWILWVIWIIGSIIGIGAQLQYRNAVTMPTERWVHLDMTSA